MQTVAELLTTDKLSELACVTLYMMYEKMNGKKSRWHHYIKELDRWGICAHSRGLVIRQRSVTKHHYTDRNSSRLQTTVLPNVE